MKDYAEKLKLPIQYNWRVSKINRKSLKYGKYGSLYTLKRADGAQVTCHVLLMATGPVSEKLPDIEGIHLADTYSTHSVNQEDYENKFVCIMGGGNSAFEVGLSFNKEL